MDIVSTVNDAKRKTDLPDLRPGMTVRVHQRIVEGDKERTQIFEGLLIRRSGGRGLNGSYTVRKISEGVGVERIFPLHSPMISKVDVVRSASVRRAKLHFVRRKDARRLEEKA